MISLDSAMHGSTHLASQAAVSREEHPAPCVELHWISLTLEPGELSRAERVLADDELARYARMLPAVRAQRVAARAGLRTLLGQKVGVDARDVMFAYGRYGKPRLSEHHRTRLEFNLAHSGRWGVVALGYTGSIGVDLELVRDDVEHGLLAECVLSKRELAFYRSLPDGSRQRAFYRAWTGKEAFIKATGLGLSQPMREVGVAWDRADAAERLTVPDAWARLPWSLLEVDAGSDFVGALVASHTKVEIREHAVSATW